MAILQYRPVVQQGCKAPGRPSWTSLDITFAKAGPKRQGRKDGIAFVILIVFVTTYSLPCLRSSFPLALQIVHSSNGPPALSDRIPRGGGRKKEGQEEKEEEDEEEELDEQEEEGHEEEQEEELRDFSRPAGQGRCRDRPRQHDDTSLSSDGGAGCCSFLPGGQAPAGLRQGSGMDPGWIRDGSGMGPGWARDKL